MRFPQWRVCVHDDVDLDMDDDLNDSIEDVVDLDDGNETDSPEDPNDDDV